MSYINRKKNKTTFTTHSEEI